MNHKRLILCFSPLKVVTFCLCLLAFSISGFSDTDATIPKLEEQDKMVKSNLLNFSKAVLAKDFVAFHGTLSKPFKEQVTPERLKEVFKVFMDQNMNLTIIKPLSPIYNQPTTMDKDGVIRITGHFNTSPSTAFFELYFYEYPNWKLLSIDVRVNTKADLKMPSSKIQLEMAKNSINGFAESIAKKDFTAFHGTLCKNFKDQFTPEQLKKAFQAFIDKKIDLLPLADETPIFHQAPFLDDDDILTIIGHYATEPNRTNFVLKYYERPNWKLLSINVNLN